MAKRTRGTAAVKRSDRSLSRKEARRHAVRGISGVDAALFAITLFTSAALLFAVQPMFAKMALPLFGGAPAVWNTCLVFYQAALLIGYLYAHFSIAWLGVRRQAMLHVAILCLPWIVLPIHIADGWLLTANGFPAFRLWLLLCVSVGLPFLVVSASAPMLQAWFAQTGKPASKDPYFLYAASNAGSLLALLAYPLAIESNLTLSGQTFYWAAGYSLLTALVLACAIRLWRSAPQGPSNDPTAGRTESPETRSERPSRSRRLRWLGLSLVPSSLLLGVTTHISTDIAAVPMLWVVPLALYLATFALVFAPRQIIPLRWMVAVQPYFIVAAAVTLLCNLAGARETALLGTLHLLAFFVTAMVCHGQLAADRPASDRLTEYYLYMSLGGVLGGLFCALIAPMLFSSVLEYPLMLAAACMLRPKSDVALRDISKRENLLIGAALVIGVGMAWALRAGGVLSGLRFADSPVMRVIMIGLTAVAALGLRRRPAQFGLAVAALCAVSLWSVDAGVRLLHSERSFFGVLRVEEDPIWNMHLLLHGSTNHGQQSLAPDLRKEPWGYYHRKGPLGAIFESLQSRRPLSDIGVLGLGIGGISAYGEPGEHLTFFEIDPAVERIARNPEYFTYLADCRARVDVVLGDARLSLLRNPDRKFDLLMIDVFSSDSVPIHLTTREALQIYLARLKPHGVLAVHVSSRYLDIEPILGNLANDANLPARICRDNQETGSLGRVGSEWIVMARSAADLGSLFQDARWVPVRCDSKPVWTDDFSDVASAIRWNTPGLHWLPWAWRKANAADEHVSVATALIEAGRIDEGIMHFKKSLEFDPGNADVHYSLGVALATRGRTDEAIAEYEDALRISPDHAAAHYNLAVALGRSGKADDAIAHYVRALEIKPDYIEALSNLGKAFAEKKLIGDAISCYRRALEIKPDSLQVRYNLASLLEQQGQFVEAGHQWHEALDLAVAQKNRTLVETIQAEIARCESATRNNEVPSPAPKDPKSGR